MANMNQQNGDRGAPSGSYERFRDRGIESERSSGPLTQNRGVAASTARQGEDRYRDDMQGGEPTGGADEYGQSYHGRMRHYRHVNGRWVAERGSHAGRGPRNYRRSDERIRDDVCEIMKDDGFLDASEIEVQVKDGEVTLEGTTYSRAEKREAERLAELIAGVQDVHNHLRIRLREEG